MTILSPTFALCLLHSLPVRQLHYRDQMVLQTIGYRQYAAHSTTKQDKIRLPSTIGKHFQRHRAAWPATSSLQLPPPVCRIQTNQEFSPRNQGFSVLGIWETCFGCTVHWTIAAGRVALMWHNNILKTSSGSEEKFTTGPSRKLHCRDYRHKVRLKSS